MTTHYENVKALTEEAQTYITRALEGNYKGYTGANAVSLYLSDEHSINVNADSTAQRAFEDALDA